jgi:hypothetical protein
MESPNAQLIKLNFDEQDNNHFRRRDTCKETQNQNEVSVALNWTRTPNNIGNIVLKGIYVLYFMTWRGVDAPELKMANGNESKNALVKLIGGKRVTIYVYGQDQFGRYVGDIYCDGVFIQVKHKLFSSSHNLWLYCFSSYLYNVFLEFTGENAEEWPCMAFQDLR